MIRLEIIKEAKFTCCPLGEAFEKQVKIIEYHGEKQIKKTQNQGQILKIKNIPMMMKMVH